LPDKRQAGGIAPTLKNKLEASFGSFHSNVCHHARKASFTEGIEHLNEKSFSDLHPEPKPFPAEEIPFYNGLLALKSLA